MIPDREGPFLFQHDNSPVHKARSIQKGLVRSGPKSVPDLTNALVAEWKQVPTAMFQHLVESLPRRVEADIAAKVGPTP